MSETMSVQWFPGHMAKTRRIMASNLKLVDIVVELCDARIPQSSRNPEIDKIVGKKPRLMLLNKADCADAAATEQWLTYYRKKGIPAMACDCRSGRGVKNLLPAVREVLAEKIAAWNEKGMVGRPIRMMIVGIPNVGKSSLINRPKVQLESSGSGKTAESAFFPLPPSLSLDGWSGRAYNWYGTESESEGANIL